MLIPSRVIIRELEKKYPAGCTVELVEMNDLQAPPPGTKGTVVCVDGIGTIHVRWETGSALGVVYGEDECKVVSAS